MSQHPSPVLPMPNVLGLVRACRQAALGTLECQSAHPYVSHVALAPLEDGRMLLWLSALAVHTRNLQADPRYSLLLTPPIVAAAPGEVPGPDLDTPRLVLMGEARPREPKSPEGQRLRHAFLACQPEALGWVDLGDFAPWVLEVQKARFIQGFGRMGWINARQWTEAFASPTGGNPGG